MRYHHGSWPSTVDYYINIIGYLEFLAGFDYPTGSWSIYERLDPHLVFGASRSHERRIFQVDANRKTNSARLDSLGSRISFPGFPFPGSKEICRPRLVPPTEPLSSKLVWRESVPLCFQICVCETSSIATHSP